MNKRRMWPVVFAAIAALLVLCGLIFGGRIAGSVKKRLYTVKYSDEICAAADAHGLPRALVCAVVRTESGFDPAAVSGAGAVGLMQVMPSTAEWIDYRRGTSLHENGLYDPETNLDYGCWLLGYLLDRYGGNERHALIAYNAGFGRADEWLKDPALLDENGEIAEIPYPETRSYVSKVLEAEKTYGELYEEFAKGK